MFGETRFGETLPATGNITTNQGEIMKLFKISGYWKDDKEPFEDYLVSEDHTVEEDDEIFFYGLRKDLIEDAISKGENTTHDFVITKYRDVEQSR